VASAPGDPCAPLIAAVSRPSFSTGACTVRSNRVIVETGYSNLVTTGPNGSIAVAYPQATIRVGTRVPNLELDVAPPSYNRAGGGPSGYGDAAFGAKYLLGNTARAVYGASVLASVPTGNPAFTSSGASYDVSANGSSTLGPILGVFGSLAFEAFAAGNDASGRLQRFGAFAPSLGFTATLPANSQIFGEAAYVSHAGYGLGGRTTYDFGYQKDLSTNVQADAEYGFSPTTILGARLHYLGAGISFRLGPSN
jgi:hypothetical protein